ncbi:MAG: hypothetical protein P9L92_15955 [Candidatus Electryonea clarkiae]|nr:hypothetical protein [Candidatus Electryonea clarkiae]MDP8285806.1 hypothetical protein [Candidatus Electryonea clarkiae]
MNQFILKAQIIGLNVVHISPGSETRVYPTVELMRQDHQQGFINKTDITHAFDSGIDALEFLKKSAIDRLYPGNSSLFSSYP